MEATVPFVAPSALPTEGLGIVETLEEHLEIMNLEVDTPEDYVGPLTGMDFAKCPTADSLTNVHNVGRNIQCSSASQTNIREITTQINQTRNNCVQPVTPVCHKTLALLLQNYDSVKANYLVCGFKNGFRIGFQGDRHFRVSPNLKSASEFPEIVEEKLAKEISQGRIAGPFHELPFVNMHISPIGVVPKKEVGQYRLIHHLSYPKDKSINDHIPEELKTVHYSSIDDAIEIILNLGPNATMAKTDISNAFRIIPIHPHDHEILGIKFNGCFYYDQCLPMGCASSCSIFEEFSCALQWIAHTKGGITHIVHVLDDFLILSGQNKNICNQNLKTFLKLCNTLGVPIKEEKTVYAQTIMTFLGIELDTIAMEARLPLDKVLKIKNSLSEIRVRRKVTLRELQSLIGLLNFACCVVQPGRTFLRRLIDRTKGIQQPHFHIRMNKESRLDIAAWLIFIEHFNGKTMLLKQIWISANKLHLYTDAAGSLGFGAIFESEWFYGSWNESVKDYP